MPYPEVSESVFRTHYQKQDHAQGRKILRFMMWVSLPLLYIDLSLLGWGRNLAILAVLRALVGMYSWWILRVSGRRTDMLQFDQLLSSWVVSVLAVQLIANVFSPASYYAHFFIDAWLCLMLPIVVPLRLNLLKQLLIAFFVFSLGLSLNKVYPQNTVQLNVVAVLILSTYSGWTIAVHLHRYRSKILSAELEMQRQESTDPVTGVANRREFLRVSDHELQRHKRMNKPLSLLVLDLDHLKQINQRYGVGVADMVLVEASRRIKRATRSYDCLARYGIEEFGVLLPEADAEIASKIAARARSTIGAMPVAASGKELKVSASVGVATMLEDDTLESFLRRAEDALNVAKNKTFSSSDLPQQVVA